jgi:CheY-like chemotaxis protein
MNPSQVLIVDDSKTAQHLLKRMLQKYNLKIDVVSSAEEALSYLSYNHPAVIFLDHQMTGMTGMEALKTIKASPHTALIPVVMYTSQQDDVFVSQAIALGAQDILAKGAMQPSNLERVLQTLNIRTDATAANDDSNKVNAALIAQQRPSTAVATPVKEQPVQDIDKVRLQIGRLFEIHIADIRNQLNNSTQFIVKRLSTNIEKAGNKEAAIGGASLSAIKSVVKNIIAAERQRIATASNVLLIAMTAGAGLLGYGLWQVDGELKEVSKNLQATAEVKKSETPAIPAASPLDSLMKDAKPGDNASLLRALGWVQNADFQFSYGEQPLNDLQLANLNKLVDILDNAGYRGPLIVDINFGNVCLEPGNGNTWHLARNDLPATQCKMLKDLSPKFQVSDYMTAPYQNFEKSALPLRDGRISIQLVSSGLSAPHVDYPIIRATTTAGEWNAAALRNNRISIQLMN